MGYANAFRRVVARSASILRGSETIMLLSFRAEFIWRTPRIFRTRNVTATYGSTEIGKLHVLEPSTSFQLRCLSNRAPALQLAAHTLGRPKSTCRARGARICTGGPGRWQGHSMSVKPHARAQQVLICHFGLRSSFSVTHR